MKKSIIAYLSIFIGAGIMVACEEQDLFGSQDAEVESRMGESLIELESQANEIYGILDRALRDSLFDAEDSTVIRGAKVLRSGTEITIDFGIGTVGPDGVTRSGAISVNATGEYLQSGSRFSGSFNQFKVEDETFGGSFDLSNAGNNVFSLKFNNFGPSSRFTLSMDKNFTWQQGITTPDDDADDQYKISGTSSGVEVESNNTITTTVKEDFLIDRSCAYNLVEGVMDITLVGDSLSFDQGSIDFLKDDGCNNIYEVTLESVEGAKVTVPLQFDNY